MLFRWREREKEDERSRLEIETSGRRGGGELQVHGRGIAMGPSRGNKVPRGLMHQTPGQPPKPGLAKPFHVFPPLLSLGLPLALRPT